MHSFVAAVLFGMPGLDPLVPNPELGQQYAERRQASGSTTSERRAVVGTNRVREAEFCEVEEQQGAHLREPGVRRCMQAQQIPAVVVGQRQWNAPGAILRVEPALVIDAPECIRSPFRRLDSLRARYTSTGPSRLSQTRAAYYL